MISFLLSGFSRRLMNFLCCCCCSWHKNRNQHHPTQTKAIANHLVDAKGEDLDAIEKLMDVKVISIQTTQQLSADLQSTEDMISQATSESATNDEIKEVSLNNERKVTNPKNITNEILTTTSIVDEEEDYLKFESDFSSDSSDSEKEEKEESNSSLCWSGPPRGFSFDVSTPLLNEIVNQDIHRFTKQFRQILQTNVCSSYHRFIDDWEQYKIIFQQACASTRKLLLEAAVDLLQRLWCTFLPSLLTRSNQLLLHTHDPYYLMNQNTDTFQCTLSELLRAYQSARTKFLRFLKNIPNANIKVVINKNWIETVSQIFATKQWQNLSKINQAFILFEDEKQCDEVLENISRNCEVLSLQNGFHYQKANYIDLQKPFCDQKDQIDTLFAAVLSVKLKITRTATTKQHKSVLFTTDSFLFSKIFTFQLFLTMPNFYEISQVCLFERFISSSFEHPKLCPICFHFQTPTFDSELNEETITPESLGRFVAFKTVWKNQWVLVNALPVTSERPKLEKILKRLFWILHTEAVYPLIAVIRKPEKEVFLSKFEHGMMLNLLLQTKRLTYEQLLRVVTVIAKLSAFLHSKHVVGLFLYSHKIFCASNMQMNFSEDLRPMLLTNVMTNKTLLFARERTFILAPEQQIDSRYEASADIYTFGCLLVELFNEHHNIVWGGRDARKQRIITGLYQPPELQMMTNLAMKNIAEKCLAWYPADRPSMQSVCELLKEKALWRD